MRSSHSSLLCLTLVLSACHVSAASNPLIGTWVTADNPVPAGCSNKIVFAAQTEYVETPQGPNLPIFKNTVHIAYGGGSDPKQLVVQNISTGVMMDWSLSDSTHAISGNFAQCHYVKQ